MDNTILNNRQSVEQAVIAADNKLATVGATDQKILKDKAVTLFDTQFIGVDQQLASYKMFTEGDRVDGIHRNKVFPSQTSAFLIHGISLTANLNFGETEAESIEMREQFFRQSALNIQKSDILIMTIPLNELLTTICDKEVSAAGVIRKERVVRDFYPLEDYLIHVAKGEKFEVQLVCDGGFKTSDTLKTKFYSVPTSAASILSSGEGNSIRLNFHAIELLRNVIV